MTELDRQKLAAARLWAAHRYPYLASALFASRVIVVPGINTIAVDEHWRLYIDPFIVQEWSVELVGSVLVHHVGHLLRDHASRARELGIDHGSVKDWTLAADMEINDDLTDLGELPGDAAVPQKFGLEPGRFAEEYFRALHELEEHPESQECGSGADANARDYEEPGEGGAIKEYGAHLLRCTVAAECLKQEGLLPGSVPAGMKRWAEDLLDAKVDWRRVLAAEIRQGLNSVIGAVDYSYSRPSRRQSVSANVVLPSMRKPLPNVAVVVDTSGSMTEALLAQVLAEVEGLLRSVGLNRDGIRVLSCDAAVHLVQRVSSVRQVELVGGGGTNMGEGIAAALKLRPRPQVIVVLTDGYTPWPESAPKGARVVIGLMADSDRTFSTPVWAKVVRIEDAA